MPFNDFEFVFDFSVLKVGEVTEVTEELKFSEEAELELLIT